MSAADEYQGLLLRQYQRYIDRRHFVVEAGLRSNISCHPHAATKSGDFDTAMRLLQVCFLPVCAAVDLDNLSGADSTTDAGVRS